MKGSRVLDEVVRNVSPGLGLGTVVKGGLRG